MNYFRDLLRRFDSYRRRWTAGLERRSLRWLAQRTQLAAPHRSPQRIVVIRCNNRIGNNLFLLPFLQKVRLAHPTASIELICSAGPLQPLFTPLPLQRIHLVTLRGKALLSALVTLWQLRREAYDRVYVPFPSSTDHLLAAWLRGADRVGFDDANGEQVLTHRFSADETCHYAHQPLRLLGMSGHPAEQISLGLPLATPHPELTALRNHYPGRPLIGFFTGARKGKGLSVHQWQRLLNQLRQLHPDALLIQFNDPAAPLPQLGEVTLTLASLCDFAHVTAGLTLFISCDTGPLHLAAASGVPCLGLFTQTDPRHYGCLGAQHHNARVTDRDQIELDRCWLSTVFAAEPRRQTGGALHAAPPLPRSVSPSRKPANRVSRSRKTPVSSKSKREGSRLPSGVFGSC